MNPKKIFLYLPLAALVLTIGCGDGELPTAVQQPQEVHSLFTSTPPVIDGRDDDAAWQRATPYKVFLNNTRGGSNLPDDGLLIEFSSTWWKVSVVDTAAGDTSEVIYVGLLATWEDNDKNLQRRMWQFDPTNAEWKQTNTGSDWLVLVWIGAARNTDIWYWDAATTNPMGYFDDMVLEGITVVDEVEPLLLRIDDLNYFNDTPDNRNTWDENYDDNLTPGDPSDDHPKFAWNFDPATVPPSLPPVFSDNNEAGLFLLASEADLLRNSPIAGKNEAVEVPGFVLEQPMGGAADVRAYGRYENGRWTLEFYRRATGSNTSDVVLNPEARFFSQLFAVAIGDNTLSPFDRDADPVTVSDATQLTFEFIFEDE